MARGRRKDGRSGRTGGRRAAGAGRTRKAVGEKGSRRRAWLGAAGFGVLALVLAVVGGVASDPTWLRTAVLTGILALVWGTWALLVRP